jgi:hypothetical protein
MRTIDRIQVEIWALDLECASSRRFSPRQRTTRWRSVIEQPSVPRMYRTHLEFEEQSIALESNAESSGAVHAAWSTLEGTLAPSPLLDVDVDVDV